MKNDSTTAHAVNPETTIDRQITITEFQGLNDPTRPGKHVVRGDRLSDTWATMRELLTTCPCVGDKHAMAYVFGELTDNRALKGSATAIHALGIDLDGVISERWAKIVDHLSELGLETVCYPTWSHLAGTKPNISARIVVQISRSVSGDEWQAFRSRAVHWLGVATVEDPAARKAEQLFYSTCPPGKEAAFREFAEQYSRTGVPLDVDRILAMPEPPAVPKRKPKAAGITDDAPPSLDHVKPIVDEDLRCPLGSDPIEHAEYLARTMSPSVDGDRAHVALLRVARALVWGLCRPADEATALIREHFNPRCTYANGAPFPWTDTEIRHKIDAASKEADEPYPKFFLLPRPVDPLKHQIIFDDHEPEKSTDAAIHALSKADIYQRVGSLVHVTRDLSPVPEKARKRAIRRPKGTPTIVRATSPLVRDLLSENSEWSQVTSKGKLIPIKAPDEVVRSLMARGQWRDVRKLVGICDFPIVAPDGAIIDTEGYDASTGVYVLPTARAEIPQGTPAELSEMLLDVVSDFPFESDAAKSAWLALVLTPLARFAFDGPIPMGLIDKNIRGCGGSLLADLVSVIATGRTLARMPPAWSAEEDQKRLLAIGMAGDPMLLIDNVAEPFGNYAIDGALTGTEISGRKLGETLRLVAPWHCMIMATGNNVVLVGDTVRRALHVRLNSPLERPEERTGFKHPNLVPWTRANRPRLLGAALGLLKLHLEADDAIDLKPWGSFEAWSDVVRGAIVRAGLPDPLDSRAELIATDSEASNVARVVDGIASLGAIGELTRLTTQEIVELAVKAPDLAAALRALAPDLDVQAVGHALRKLRNRVTYGGKVLRRGSNKNHVATWYVSTTN